MSSHTTLTTTFQDAWPLPKITPFRLSFFLVMGGLGITKAILASNGNTTSSTTIEWIAGVVVSLLWVTPNFKYQFLSSWEYNDARPQYLDLFFCYDILKRSKPGPAAAVEEPLHRSEYQDTILAHIGRPGPKERLMVSHHPIIITGYRLLVSSLVTTFGLAKMLCGYLGFSSAMSTLDWIITIPLTLGLYSLGLYEESRARSLRKLFEVNYYPQTARALRLAFELSIFFGVASIPSYWVILSHDALRKTLAWSVPGLHDDNKGAFVKVCLQALRCCIVLIAAIFLSIGGLGIGALLWPIINARSNHYGRILWSHGTMVATAISYAVFGATGLLLILGIILVLNDAA